MSFFKRIGKTLGKVAPIVAPALMLGNLASGRGPFGGGGGAGAPPGNPAAAGMGYLDQIPGAVGEYYKPFIAQGQQAQSAVNPIYGRMSQDPTEFINSIMRGYSPSEGYKFKEREMTRAAQNDAAQGGFSGTRTSQMQQADLVRGLLGEDMQKFLENILGVQKTGLGGQESRIERGFNAGTGYGDIVGSNLGQQGGFGFQGENQVNLNAIDRQRMKQDRRSSFLNFLSGGLGAGASLMGGR